MRIPDFLASKQWWGREPRWSRLGRVTLVLSIVSSGAYLIGVFFPGRGIEEKTVIPAILGSGVSILLSFISLAFERTPLPGLLSLSVLAIVENYNLPLIPFWTFLLAPGIGVLYALALITAVSVAFFRLLNVLAMRIAAKV